MLNWIDKNERLPTKEDADNGNVYALTQNAIVACVHINHFKTCVLSFTHWLPFREMPIPKRWRTPTIHDLAKAGKPIPCRVRVEASCEWEPCEMRAIDVKKIDRLTYWCGGETMRLDWYAYCEICDE